MLPLDNEGGGLTLLSLINIFCLELNLNKIEIKEYFNKFHIEGTLYNVLAHNKKLTHIKELICEAINMYIEVLLYNVDIYIPEFIFGGDNI